MSEQCRNACMHTHIHMFCINVCIYVCIYIYMYNIYIYIYIIYIYIYTHMHSASHNKGHISASLLKPGAAEHSEASNLSPRPSRFGVDLQWLFQALSDCGPGLREPENCRIQPSSHAGVLGYWVWGFRGYSILYL